MRLHDLMRNRQPQPRAMFLRRPCERSRLDKNGRRYVPAPRLESPRPYRKQKSAFLHLQPKHVKEITPPLGVNLSALSTKIGKYLRKTVTIRSQVWQICEQLPLLLPRLLFAIAA